MDTQNVSAQLYLKQLPAEPSSGSFNCRNDTYPNLSTCVDNVATDAQIENAFQEQLDLSLIYKSPEIFKKTKEEFMDKTMEAQNKPVDPINQELPPPPSVPLNKKVGSTDFLRAYIKEGFGKTSGCMFMVVLVLVLLIAAFYYFNKTNFFKTNLI
jgi:hypothetical protein